MRGRRDQGGDAYPLRLTRLAELVGPELDSAVFAKAIKNKAFTEAVLLAQKKNPQTLLALKEDADRLAGSNALLLDVMEQVCTPASPAVQPAKLAKRIEAPLRPAFSASLARRLTDGTLPAEISATTMRMRPPVSRICSMAASVLTVKSSGSARTGHLRSGVRRTAIIRRELVSPAKARRRDCV